MKKYLTIMVTIMCLCIFACGPGDKGESVEESQTGVTFAKLSLQDAMVKAKEQNRLIVIDFFSPTWGGCIELDRSVWQDTEVGKYVNDTYLPLRVDTADEDYPQYREDYSVRGTPTILWLDSEGKEIDRIVGFDGDRDKFFQTLQDFAVGKNTLPALTAEFDKNPEDVDLNFKMAKKYQARYEEAKAQPFFEKVLALDPENQKGFQEESSYELAVYESRSNRNPEPLKAFIATNPSEKYLKNAYSNLAFSYQRLKDNDNMVATYEEALTKFPDDANMMISFAVMASSFNILVLNILSAKVWGILRWG